MYRKRTKRLGRLSGTLILIIVLTFGLVTQTSAAVAAPPSATQTSINALYASTKLAVSSLQKSPNIVRQVAARLIIAEAKLLLTPRPTSTAHATPAVFVDSAAVVTAAAASSPGVDLGGLNLNEFCQSQGDASSSTPYPGEEVPGGAYTWSCLSSTGAAIPITMQAACYEQYPGQVAIAYPQDPNNSYSWICITPSAGSYTDPTTGATVDTVITATSAATIITDSSSTYVTVDDNGNISTVVLNSDGSGDMAADGSSGGGVAILVYVSAPGDGSGGGGVAI
jgi:hypothetical protein